MHITLSKVLIILIGIISLLSGKLLPNSLMWPKNKTKVYKIIDKDRYIKSCRRPLYVLGLYYILLGTVLLFIYGWSWYVILFATIVPILIGFVSWRKCSDYVDLQNK